MLRKADRKDFVKALQGFAQSSFYFNEKSAMIKKNIKGRYVANELYVVGLNGQEVGYCTISKEVDLDFDVSVYIDKILLVTDKVDYYVQLFDDVVNYARYANVVRISCPKDNKVLQKAIDNYFHDAIVFDCGTSYEYRCKTLKYFRIESSNSYANLLLEN